MRADRLVAIILTLQARRQATASELAEELGVSERTIRRDLDALIYAGVPVYAQRGRGGGWALLGGHRLNVSGLTAEEAQALTLMAGPVALGELGMEQEVRSAVRKLLAVLPEPVRKGAIEATALIHHDPSSWGGLGGTPERSPHLPALRRAIFCGLQVDLDYERPNGECSSRRAHPLGLVQKRNAWYLLALTAAGSRTFRVSRVRAVSITEEPALRPEGFDLESMWSETLDAYSRSRPTIVVRFRIEPGFEESISRWLGLWIPIIPVEPDCYESRFPNEEVAAMDLGRLGRRVEVISPPEVRRRLADLGQDLLDRYAADAPVSPSRPASSGPPS
ncbi:MAG: helix-turn-helix transcriptional regulator [Acidimicrobiales bacterium]